MSTKNNPGRFDCYDAAGADEPMFVLLARDEKAPAVVEEWANLRIKAGKNHVADTQIVDALKCAQQMRDWRINNISDK